MWTVPRGKREQKRERTRAELRRCALEQFRASGFDKTSVAEIARAAGVTERTFYRHFPSKEAVLFHEHERRLEWFGSALAQRPGDEPFLDSVRIAVESYPEDREVVRQVAQLRASLLSRPAIEAHLQRVQWAFAGELREQLMKRLRGAGDLELAAVALSHAIAGVLIGALEVWGWRGAADTDALGELTRRSLDLLRALPREITGPEG
jgi:AcrR family transcriptional regulator